MAEHVEVLNDRLKDLSELTKEYSTYSRTAFGLAWVGAGVWLFAALLVRARSPEWSRLLFLLSPTVWLLSLARARAHYQRHGAVIQDEHGMATLLSSRSGELRAMYILATLNICWLMLEQQGSGWTGVGYMLGLFAAVAGLVAVPLLAQRITRGRFDAVVSSGMLAGGTIGGHEFATWVGRQRQTANLLVLWYALILFILGMLVLMGALQHRNYRRLERRLAKLRVQGD
jgi:hypothetical protein